MLWLIRGCCFLVAPIFISQSCTHEQTIAHSYLRLSHLPFVYLLHYCITAKSNTLVYFIFADHQCTKAIKRVVHNLYDAIPKYGECVPSLKGDQRMMLTVCHNDVEPVEYLPPPVVE